MILTSIANESYMNASYQNEYAQEHYFKSDSKQPTLYAESDEKILNNIHAEIEYEPMVQDSQTGEMSDDKANNQEWENIEMFSSKKFSDIMAKHKQRTRYHESIDQEDESYMDFQSNRKSNAGLQVVDILDDDRDIIEHKTYQNTHRNQHKIDYNESPLPETFDKIRKVEVSDIKASANSRELKYEDLSSTTKKRSELQSTNKLSSRPSAFEMREDKIFTTSINLLEFDLLSAEKSEAVKDKNSKTQDCREDYRESSREDSLEKPPKWNFIGSNRENFFDGGSTSKKVIIDDFDEFKYDDQNEEEEELVKENENLDAGYEFGTSERNSCYINEDLADGDNFMHENVSCFDEDDDNSEHEEHIPFDLGDEDNANERCFTEEQDEGAATLQQMRMLFGSEQKIREQSEAAIHHFNHDVNEEQEESDFESLRTPGGFSQSVQDPKTATAKSNVFNRQSFQEFSLKKFQEIMFENNLTNFMDSVERTIKQNNEESKTHRPIYDDQKGIEKSMTPNRKTKFVSPRKVSRKELELDRIVGNKMRHMSEKKKLRTSMLDNTDSSLIKDITQDPLNQSVDVYKAKYANYSRSNTNLQPTKKPKMIGSEINMPLNASLKMHDPKQNMLQIDRTESVVVKNKLDNLDKPEPSASYHQNESVKRSDVRGLEVLLSEKSLELEPTEQKLSSQKHEDSEDGKTLRYGTDERTDRSGSSKSKQSQKEAMYGQLEKIMSN